MNAIWIILLIVIGVVIFWKLASAPMETLPLSAKTASICLSCTNLETKQSGRLRRCLKQDNFTKELGEDAWGYTVQRFGGVATDCSRFMEDVCPICKAVRGTHRSQCPNTEYKS